MITREQKLELMRRALGLRHKIKVHNSMPQPDTHDAMVVFSLALWELEDELNAIEEILRDNRAQCVADKKKALLEHGPHSKQKVEKKNESEKQKK
jgi:hypothetical protein